MGASLLPPLTAALVLFDIVRMQISLAPNRKCYIVFKRTVM